MKVSAKIDWVLRHPLLLLIIGFIITGFLANWFIHRMDEQQKRREATVKTYGALRSADNDLTMSLAQYDRGQSRMAQAGRVGPTNGKNEKT